MNIKNMLTVLAVLLDALNTALNIFPWHGILGDAAIFARAIVDQFWPAQSNVPTPPPGK